MIVEIKPLIPHQRANTRDPSIETPPFRAGRGHLGLYTNIHTDKNSRGSPEKHKVARRGKQPPPRPGGARLSVVIPLQRANTQDPSINKMIYHRIESKRGEGVIGLKPRFISSC